MNNFLGINPQDIEWIGADQTVVNSGIYGGIVFYFELVGTLNFVQYCRA